MLIPVYKRTLGWSGERNEQVFIERYKLWIQTAAVLCDLHVREDYSAAASSFVRARPE